MPPDKELLNRSLLLAAQPIYDRANKIAGVELLYRNEDGLNAMEVGESRATSELLFNLCTGITSQMDPTWDPVFLNVSADFLTSGAFLPIDADKVVIELVERLEPTKELIEAVERWRSRGYRFALDDFEFKPSWDPLLKLASFIKVDIATVPFEQAVDHRERLAAYPLQWLAERVETEDEREKYLDAGFDLFQGYFLARPKLIYGRRLNPVGTHLARIISLVYAPEPDVKEVTAAISADPALAVSLLRIVNSPLYRGFSEINSIERVVLRLGFDALRRWVILISTINASSPEPARLILTRAQVCSELAERSRSRNVSSSQAFLVGLLSGVDALMGVELDVFLAQLNLPAEIHDAIIYGRGALGRILSTVRHVEETVAMKRGLDALNPAILVLYEDCRHHVNAMFQEIG